MASTTNRTPAAAPVRLTSLTEYRARIAGRPAPAGGSPVALPDATLLHSFFARSAASGSTRRHLHGFVAFVLARAGRVDEVDGPEWGRFLRILDRHRDNAKAELNCAVLANLVGIAVFGDAADLVALGDLAEEFGTHRIATVQHRAARFIEPNPTYPLTTRALRRMVAASRDPVAGGGLESAVTLLLEGIDPEASLPVVRTTGELLGLVDGGSVLEWRHHLAMIAASPWSPYSRHLGELAVQACLPLVATVVERFTELCREQLKEREREQVAEEVRRLVSTSGVTQRQFAQWIGTSPSRLSTYISGSVTPSASLMLRMTRTSRLLQEREVPEIPSAAASGQTWGAARTAVDGRGSEGGTGPDESASGALVRGRSHLSAV